MNRKIWFFFIANNKSKIIKKRKHKIQINVRIDTFVNDSYHWRGREAAACRLLGHYVTGMVAETLYNVLRTYSFLKVRLSPMAIEHLLSQLCIQLWRVSVQAADTTKLYLLEGNVIILGIKFYLLKITHTFL